jgi:transporter family-2 protein
MDTLFCLVVVVAGVSVSLQQVVNARLRAELGSPWWAGLVSFLGGTLVMLIVVVTTGESLPSGTVVARTSWASWTGGIFGALFVGVAILMVPRLGATAFVALVVVGQMLGSLTFDHFGVLGIPQHSASPVRLVGAALLILGVVLVR